MMKRLVITRGAMIGIFVCGLGLIAAVIWIALLNGQLHDQQNRDNDLLHKNQHTLTLVCKLTTGMALNQPDLDPRFLRILDDIIGDLPPRCFPK